MVLGISGWRRICDLTVLTDKPSVLAISVGFLPAIRISVIALRTCFFIMALFTSLE